jgi:NTE family protein
VHLGDADLIVGTSAGAIVGAILASRQDPARLAGPPALPDRGGVRTDRRTLAAVFATLSDPALSRAEALRRVGSLAVTASTGQQEAATARMQSLIGTEQWPDRPLLIPSVDAGTGTAMIWDSRGAASLAQAVAASTAFPATAPPVAINGRRYIDGALRAGSNADLAGTADLVIIIEPAAQALDPAGAAAGDAADAEAVVRLIPDARAIEAFGPDITDLASWGPAYQAGFRQAPGAAERIRSRSARPGQRDG